MMDMLPFYCDLLPGVCPSSSTIQVNYIICAIAAAAIMVIVGSTYWYVQLSIEDRNIPKPAILVAVVASGAIAFALSYFFQTTTAYNGAEFWRTLSYFAIAIVAIITFVTTVWRGTIALTQAKTAQNSLDATREQIAATERANMAQAQTAQNSLDATREQIAATERANMAQTIKEAVGLIRFEAEPEAAEAYAHNRAGLVLLYSVAMTPEGGFGRQAAQIIGDFLRNKTVYWGTVDPKVDAINYLIDIARKHDTTIFLKDTTISENQGGLTFRLAPEVRIKRFLDIVIDASRVVTLTGQIFENCEIADGDFGTDNSAEFAGENRFVDCNIRDLHGGAVPDQNFETSIIYMNCNFIGTRFLPRTVESTFRHCTFDPANPPSDAILEFAAANGGELTPLQEYS